MVSAARKAAASYDEAAWDASIAAAPGVIELEKKSRKNETSARLARIDAMEQNWPAIEALLKDLPSAAHVRDLLEGLGSPSLPSQIEVDRDLLKNTFLYCKETRARYTILQMLWDLCVLEATVDAVIVEL